MNLTKIKKVQNHQFNFYQIFSLVITITIIRILFDFILLKYPVELPLFQHYLRFFLENIYYFVIVFYGMTALLSKIIKIPFSQAANYGIKIYPIIILPPIIDYVFFGLREGYTYATKENFFYNLFTISWIKGDASFGISFEITLALLLIAPYLFIKSKSFLKTIVGSFLLIFSLVIISTPELFLGEELADYVWNGFLPLFYYIPSMILAIILLVIFNKKVCIGIFTNIRPVRSLLFVVATFAGGLAVTAFGYDFWLTETLLVTVAIFFVWQTAIVINDIHDIQIDKISNRNRPLIKKLLTVSEYRFVAIVFSIFALSFGSMVNVFTAMGTSIALILAYIYSTPPLRLRNNFLGHILIGLSLAISFSVGLLTIGVPSILEVQKNISFLVLLIIFGSLIALSKDLKDIKGDSKANVKNLFTLFGKKRAKRAITIFVLVTFNTSALLFQNKIYTSAAFLLSIFASYIFHKREKETDLYLCSLVLALIAYIQFYY